MYNKSIDDKKIFNDNNDGTIIEHIDSNCSNENDFTKSKNHF